MPIFELQSPDGKTFEVDAPHMGAAVSAASGVFGGTSAAAPPAGMGNALTDIPHEAYQATADTLGSIRDNLNPLNREGVGVMEGLGKTGKGLAALASLPFAPAIGAARSLIGHPFADLESYIGSKIAPDIAAKENPADVYERGKNAVDTASMAIGAKGGLRPPPAAVPPVTPLSTKPGIAPGSASADFNIPLTAGQASGDFSKIQYEQAAARGGYGPQAQQVAADYFDQQRAATDAAKAGIGRGLDQFGQQVAADPIAAAELASEGLKKTAAQQKAAYKASYDQFAQLPGEVHAGAFEGIAQKIKGDLSLRDNPVIIDDVTTPIANRALQDIETHIDQLKIQNRADPFGQPNPENITGVSLQGVDQTRKRLVSFAQAAKQNPADYRATRAIINAFDSHVEDSIANGLFSGSDQALATLKDARAKFADYQKMFTQQQKDGGVGRVMDQIVGRDGGAGATANEVANYLYGASGTGATGLSVRLGQRIKGVLGEQSPEWSGVRQGMWKRLTETPDGKTDWGPQQMSQRIFEFLNGSGQSLSKVLYSPAERTQMLQFAKALKEQVPPVGAVNHSNTAYVGSSIVRNTFDAVMSMLGFAHGGFVGLALGPALRVARNTAYNSYQASKVGKSLAGMPIPRPPSGPSPIAPFLPLGSQAQQ